MKKAIIAFSMVLITTFNFAQSNTAGASREKPTKTIEQDAKEKTTSLTEKLELNSDQQAKAYTMVVDFLKEKAALAALKATNAADYKTKVTEVGKNYVEKVKTILTVDQQKKLDDLIAERQAKKAGRE